MEYPKELIELVHYAKDQGYRMLRIKPDSSIVWLRRNDSTNIRVERHNIVNDLFTIDIRLNHINRHKSCILYDLDLPKLKHVLRVPSDFVYTYYNQDPATTI